MPARRIILPVDGSQTAEAAARFAEDIAASEGDVIVVLGVAASLPDDDRSGVNEAVAEFMATTVAEEAARIRQAGILAEELVVHAESPVEGILRVSAEQSVDAIVMGTHGRTGLKRAIIGSVADGVVRRSTVPVVLVPLKSED